MADLAIEPFAQLEVARIGFGAMRIIGPVWGPPKDRDEAIPGLRRRLASADRLHDQPSRMLYGGMDAVFEDTCGNLVNLHQE